MLAAERRPFVSVVAPLATPRDCPRQPPPVPTLRASELSQDQKRQLFAWMRKHDPAQAAFWMDPAVVAVREFYEGVAVFEVAYLRRAGVVT